MSDVNYQRYLNRAIAAVPPSGIRRFFDLASTMKGVISLGVGEPDFVTPYHIRNAAIDSLLRGETSYTPNRGLLELREEISLYLDGRFGVKYDPATEMTVTVGASEAIDTALRAILEPGDEVLVPEPSYVSYSPSVIFAGGTPVGVLTRAEKEFRLTAEAVRRAAHPAHQGADPALSQQPHRRGHGAGGSGGHRRGGARARAAGAQRRDLRRADLRRASAHGLRHPRGHEALHAHLQLHEQVLCHDRLAGGLYLRARRS